MKFRRLAKIMTGVALALAVTVSAVDVAPVYADENVEGEAAEGETAEDGEYAEEGEYVEGVDDEYAAAPDADAVIPGTIIANNGMYIANSFPDSYLPSGFRKQVVAYQGQNIELAYMDASNGLVSLAYLTDATGSFGDFYLCDTTTATMTDYVRFEGGNDKFIIVLDPGSNKAPDGFQATALAVNGKSVTAWVYTGEASDDSDDEDDDEKGGFLSGILGYVGPVEAYAGELDLGIGVGAGNDEGIGDVSVDTGSDFSDAEAQPAYDQSGTVDAQPVESTPVDTASYDASALVASGVEASVSDYFLVYAIDQSGNQGFYLYDSVGQTYQRYASFGTGTAEELEKAQKSARIRLFIIAGLIVLLVILIIILVNMALSGRRGDDYYDDGDDYEEMKRRVEKKSKRASRSARNDYDDDYDDYDDDYDDGYDDEEDVRVYSRKSQQTAAPAQAPVRNQGAPVQQQLQPRRQAPAQDIDLDDDFSFDFIKR